MNTTTKTAPDRIWLQINPDAAADYDDGSIEDGDLPFPDDDVTWCRDSIGGLEVEYIKADLLVPLRKLYIDMTNAEPWEDMDEPSIGGKCITPEMLDALESILVLAGIIESDGRC